MTQMTEHFTVRVRMVETMKGVTGEARVVASFTHQAAAEGFIRVEVMKWKTFGCKEGQSWGRNNAHHHVRYWTETQQETASVKEAHLHDGKAAPV